jgi:hypothetical protein
MSEGDPTNRTHSQSDSLLPKAFGSCAATIVPEDYAGAIQNTGRERDVGTHNISSLRRARSSSQWIVLQCVHDNVAAFGGDQPHRRLCHARKKLAAHRLISAFLF